jgi:hypothetical protein
LENLYTQHKYASGHIWNLDKTGIEVGHQSSVRFLAKRGLQDVYNTIPKSQEWLTTNFVINVVGATLPAFYIFKGSKM